MNEQEDKYWEANIIKVQGEIIYILDKESQTITAKERKDWLASANWQYEKESLLREINAREPHNCWKQIFNELEKRGEEAAKLRGDGIAGKIMWGQAQGYRDAAALIRGFIGETS